MEGRPRSAFRSRDHAQTKPKPSFASRPRMPPPRVSRVCDNQCSGRHNGIFPLRGLEAFALPDRPKEGRTAMTRAEDGTLGQDSVSRRGAVKTLTAGALAGLLRMRPQDVATGAAQEVTG